MAEEETTSIKTFEEQRSGAEKAAKGEEATVDKKESKKQPSNKLAE